MAVVAHDYGHNSNLSYLTRQETATTTCRTTNLIKLNS